MTTLKRQAVDLLRANRIEDAKTLLRDVCDRHPRDAEAWHMLGSVQGMLGNMDEAADCCRRVIALKPDHGQSYVNLGNVSLSRGEHDEAMGYYRQALEVEPNLDTAHYGLGNLFVAMGKYSEARESYERVVRIKPDHAAAYNKLGNVAAARGDWERAVGYYTRAVGLKPNFAQAHNNLGVALTHCGQLDEAIDGYRRAIEIRPDYAEANYNLGNSLNQRGREAEAADFLRRAVTRRPDFAEAYNSLGVALMSQKRLEDAKEAFSSALNMKPDFVEAVYNYAHVNHALGLTDIAIEHYRRAIRLRPDYPEAYMNLGTAMKERGDPDRALENYRHAVRLRPDFAAAYNFMGITYREQGKLREAAEMSEKAVEIQPDFVDAYFNLANVHAAAGDMKASVERFRRILELEPDRADAHSAMLMNMTYLPDPSPEEALEEAKAWASLHVPAGQTFPRPAEGADPDRPLRIGYVSGDFCRHPVGFFIEPIIARHDAGYEVYCYYNNDVYDEVTGRIRACARHWREICGVSDDDLVRQIRRDGIDILVDLSGHTARHRLCAFGRKPAPVQATWIGYAASTGVDAMDYIIADRILIPPGEERFYVEKPARMPHDYVCFSPPDGAGAVAAAPAQASGFVTFGSLNNLGKVTPSVVACWSEVLRAVPDARLILKYRWLNEAAVRRRYREMFASHGVDLERIVLSGYSDRAGMLAAYNEIDIALDPFPYNGGMTTLEALWMGVPVITLRGDRFVSRIGESAVTALGMEEWVGDTRENYVAKAAALASDIPRLAEVRRGLRERMANSPLCDVDAFVKALEAEYRRMWERWCAGR